MNGTIVIASDGLMPGFILRHELGHSVHGYSEWDANAYAMSG